MSSTERHQKTLFQRRISETRRLKFTKQLFGFVMFEANATQFSLQSISQLTANTSVLRASSKYLTTMAKFCFHSVFIDISKHCNAHVCQERRAELTSETWAKIKLLNQNLVRETITLTKDIPEKIY